VLVNIWRPGANPVGQRCRSWTSLYKERKHQGFIVFGISDEDINLQRKYVEQAPVTYPLLTLSGEVPDMYREIARYPAIFLIDRQGRLKPAPGPDQPFERVEAAVDALLKSGS
jgi:peroxiredoxin